MDKNEIIEKVKGLLMLEHPNAKANQVIIAKGCIRIPVDMIEVESIGLFEKTATIYSIWYVGGELPHILPLTHEHVALGALLERGYVEPKIRCIFVVKNEEEKQTWENWYKQFTTRNISVFRYSSFEFPPISIFALSN